MKYVYGSDFVPVEQPLIRQPYQREKYKLQIGTFFELKCVVERPFIPVAAFQIPDGDFTSQLNGVGLKAKDLRALLLLQPSIDIAVQCLTLWDLTDFFLTPGEYSDTAMDDEIGKTNYLLYLTQV